MSARDALAASIEFCSSEQRQAEADYIMRRLSARGYRILAPGEMDRETLEAAAKILDRRAAEELRYSERHKETGRHFKAREASHVARLAYQDAAAIRALGGGVG